MGELHERDLEEQTRIGRVAHLDEDLAEPFHRLHDLARTEATRLLGHDDGARVGQGHQLGRHQRQEAVAQVAHHVLGERARVATLLDGEGHRGERPARIELDQRLDELVVLHDLEVVATGARHQFERAQRVAGRPATLFERRHDRRLAHLQPGVVGHPADVLLELVHRQQVEPEVLRATADGVADLLRIGGREHEHDVRRRLLERLQQGGLGRLGEHVHLVEDVHLVPTGRAERGLLDEVAHRVDAVVAGRVELVHVVAGAPLDRQARVALAARLALDRALAVEHLGQDARRRGLAGAARAGEEVGLALAVVDDRIAQRPHDVLLPTHLAEAAGAVAAVERLGGHRGEPTQRVCGRSRRRPTDHVDRAGPRQAITRGGSPEAFTRTWIQGLLDARR